jgi:hypothetical protein
MIQSDLTPIRARLDPLIASVVIPLLLGIVCASACYGAAGPSLGLFFGGVAVITLLIPPLIAYEPGRLRPLLAALATIAGVAAVWAAAVFRSELRAVQWLEICLVLLAYGLALGALTIAIASTRLGSTTACAAAVALGIAWIAWPVWLAPHLAGDSGQRMVAWLGPAHPLLTINGVLPFLGNWTEQPVAYQITNLNQDVPFDPPTAITWAALVHGAIALLLGALVCWQRRPRRQPERTTDSTVAPITSTASAPANR